MAEARSHPLDFSAQILFSFSFFFILLVNPGSAVDLDKSLHCLSVPINRMGQAGFSLLGHLGSEREQS